MMGRMGTPPGTPPASDPKASAPRELAPGETSEPTGSPRSRHGLWDLMGRRDAAARQTELPASVDRGTTPEPRRDDLQTQAADESLAVVVVSDSDHAPLRTQSLGLDDFVAGVRDARPESRRGWGLASLALGLISIPLALPALFHQSPLVFLPSGILGFCSLCFGLATVNAIRRRRVQTTGGVIAVAGMSAGVVAMFLGPVVLSGVGRRWAAESRRTFTESHLLQIGDGLNAFHNARGVFPAGGVFKPIAGGTEQGLHGWMSLLLPYLGEPELFNRIDLQRAFSDEVNLPAMGTDLPVFWSAGGDRSKVAGKFGVAHFAGVGGEFINEDGEQVEAGIFDVNSEITRDLVTDGLSNTIIAGEVSTRFPAWGDPENWRQVGRGLNQDPEGFGNVEGTGAMFLMGDGSVRFLSRHTSRRVLEGLSTRNSADE